MPGKKTDKRSEAEIAASKTLLTSVNEVRANLNADLNLTTNAAPDGKKLATLMRDQAKKLNEAAAQWDAFLKSTNKAFRTALAESRAALAEQDFLGAESKAEQAAKIRPASRAPKLLMKSIYAAAEEAAYADAEKRAMLAPARQPSQEEGALLGAMS